MSIEKESSMYDIEVPESLEDVNLLAGEIGQTNQLIQAATDTEKQIISGITQQTARIVDPLIESNEIRKRLISDYFLTHSKQIRRTHGKTVKLPNGVFRWFERPRIDLPKNTDLLVRWLLGRIGGKRYLSKPKYEINKSAVQNADPRTVALMRGFGVWRGTVEHFSLHLTGSDTNIPISERKLRRRSPR